MLARWVLVVLCTQLAGCAAVSGFPHPAVDHRLEEAELAPYVGPEAIARYEACVDKIACRNTIIDARVRAVDLAFYRFERRTFGQEAGISLGSDVLALGLDSMATISGTRALAAGAGALTGGRDAYEKQVLGVSLPLLFEEMVANRRELLVRIRQGQQMPVAAYTLFQALSDISEYELAGSIPHAAGELTASAGAEARAAEGKLAALRAASFAAAAPVPAPAPVVLSAPAAPSPAPSPSSAATPRVVPTPPPPSIIP